MAISDICSAPGSLIYSQKFPNEMLDILYMFTNRFLQLSLKFVYAYSTKKKLACPERIKAAKLYKTLSSE